MMPEPHNARAHCMRCNLVFMLPDERGRTTHILYCIRCGRYKRIGLREIREYLRKNPSALSTPPAIGEKKPGTAVRPVVAEKDLDMRKYLYAVEHLAGTCVCGSIFRFSGKPRCPKCRSTAIRNGGEACPPGPAFPLPSDNNRGVA